MDSKTNDASAKLIHDHHHPVGLENQRFGDDGSSTTRPKQAGNRYDKVYEKNGEITNHRTIVAKSTDMTRLGNFSNSCTE